MHRLAALAWVCYYSGATLVQTNDPDAGVWVCVYGVPLLLVLWTLLGPDHGQACRLRIAFTISAFSAMCAALMSTGIHSWQDLITALPRPYQWCEGTSVWKECIERVLMGYTNYLKTVSTVVATEEPFREQLGLLLISLTLPWVVVVDRCATCDNLSKLTVGTALTYALVTMPAALKFSGDHCGGPNSH